MQMNSGIILSGQQPNLLAAMMEGQQAAQQQNALATDRQTRELYAKHGAGMVAGDPAAINALAGMNPEAALGIQGARLGMDQTRLGMDATRLGMDQTRQEMQFSKERLQMAYASAAQEAQQAAINLSKEQREAEAAKLDGLLSGAAFFYSKGDRAGYEAYVAQNGLDAGQYPFEQFPAIAARGKGTLDALKTFSDMAKGPEGPKPTADMIEYGAAKAEGYAGTLEDWTFGKKKASAPGVTINTGDNAPGIGKLSTDYGYVLDPVTRQPVIDASTGLPMSAPIPGSPAARDLAASTAKAELADKQAAASAAVVLQDIDKAIEQTSGWTAGAGSAIAKVPGTPARNLEGSLNTIKANIGFDRLQQMREASPTGGALGGIAVQELMMLQAVLGSLDQAQSPAQLRENLARLKEIYAPIAKKAAAYPNAAEFGFGGGEAPGPADVSDDDLLQMYGGE